MTLIVVIITRTLGDLVRFDFISSPTISIKNLGKEDEVRFIHNE